mmetsp:Transcript_32825/g.49507  ORF Transcript_32825/g.49507 Transcript_32825/m.49507 type:complete len:124 (-) Transcript_32825:1339-1710(-)
MYLVEAYLLGDDLLDMDFPNGLIGWNADKCQKHDSRLDRKYEGFSGCFGYDHMNELKQSRAAFVCFESVDAAFQIQQGMVVDIMACSCKGLLATSIKEHLQSCDYEARAGDIFITVGQNYVCR